MSLKASIIRFALTSLAVVAACVYDMAMMNYSVRRAETSRASRSRTPNLWDE
jgi:hypothetical protein